ncbi:MAG: SDR family oxidoreductase [Planctomycetota bacterium]|nr:MAG: SDR family oxidoreductase [Planctomycetota bacterium]
MDSLKLRSLCATIQQARPDLISQFSEQAITGATAVASLDAIAAALGAPGATVPKALEYQGMTVELAPCPPAEGPLAGQVALVSGAASGLGLGVARGLYAAGAMVCLTDIDGPGLDAVRAEFADPARICSAVVNVTNEESVIAGFDAAITRWGRVDAIACCAGIAPPFELVDFPLDKWRLALEINLTGYFLMGREAARIMKAQGHGGSMVLLSSKSGLEPSKANSAYNATKAGELHLARGWALELGRDGIRVNCIAPGNVFEGSKIWNPEYIAKAAAKKGIQPDEVIPYYNNLTAMNAEIKPEDIANAAVFLCSAAARRMTGQVLVVDAGQVWTR